MTTMRVLGFWMGIAMLPAASSFAATKTSFKLSPEAWQRRCPVIESYAALEVRGIRMRAVNQHAVYSRFSETPEKGIVVLDARIDFYGKVLDLQLVSATSAGLVAPALHTVSSWRFAPVEVNGVEVCVERRLDVPVYPYQSEPPGWNGSLAKRSKDYANPPPPPGAMPRTR